MASAVFFLDLKGKTLLARNYRGDIPMSAVEMFPVLLSEAEEESSAVPPCFSHEGINVRICNIMLEYGPANQSARSISTSDTTTCTCLR
jgi:AP-1 complex subunit mu